MNVIMITTVIFIILSLLFLEALIHEEQAGEKVHMTFKVSVVKSFT